MRGSGFSGGLVVQFPYVAMQDASAKRASRSLAFRNASFPWTTCRLMEKVFLVFKLLLGPAQMNLQRPLLHVLRFQLVTVVAGGIFLADLNAETQPVLTRVPNTTLSLPAEPPTHGYSLTNAFGTLRFTNPTMAATPPGETNRLFVLERGGRIIVITNLAAPTRTVFLDISHYIDPDYLVSGEEGLLGLAFHPGYSTNRYFFLTFGLFIDTAQGSGRHQRLARFQASANDPNFAFA